MDMIKIGNFIKERRLKLGLTQEQLGEKLGVTNKTVSRWETGTYLPPVEMLQMLSGIYGVSINEILAGESLTDEEYRKKADENVVTALDGSVFSMREKRKFYWRKWMRKYAVLIALYFAVVITLSVLGMVYDNNNDFIILDVTISFCGVIIITECRSSYIEKNVYNDKIAELEARYGIPQSSDPKDED